MKNPAISNSALTLTELLITSMLIGVAVVGIVSVDTAIRRTQNVASIRLRNTTQLSAALVRIKKMAWEARGSGVITVPQFGSFPNVQTDPVGVIIDRSESISADPGFCFRDLLGSGTDLFDAQIICYHGSTSGVTERVFSLTWQPQSSSLICDQCDFVMEELPGGGQPLSTLTVEISRAADPSQPDSDLTNPRFSIQTGFSFSQVSR